MNLMGSGLWGVGFSVVTARSKKLLKRFMATPMRKSDYLLAFILLAAHVPGARDRGAGRVRMVDVRCGCARLDCWHLQPSRYSARSRFAGLGLLVASRARTVEAVSGLANMVMLPMWILSGTFFSYARFPEAMLPVGARVAAHRVERCAAWRDDRRGVSGLTFAATGGRNCMGHSEFRRCAPNLPLAVARRVHQIRPVTVLRIGRPVPRGATAADRSPYWIAAPHRRPPSGSGGGSGRAPRGNDAPRRPRAAQRATASDPNFSTQFLTGDFSGPSRLTAASAGETCGTPATSDLSHIVRRPSIAPA